MRNTLSRKLLATAAVGAFTFGVAACSSDGDLDDPVDDPVGELDEPIDPVEDPVDDGGEMEEDTGEG